MDHFYHYTSQENFADVVSGGKYRTTGLIPRRRFMPLGLAEKFNLPPKAGEGAVFGLLEPQPAIWMEQEYHEGEGLLETILKDMVRGDEMLLLRCEVLPTDDVHVADHVFHMRPDYNGNRDLDNPATGEVKRAYWNSLIPLAQYNGQHIVPEVISFSPIPLERISIERIHDSYRDLLNELRSLVGKPLLPPPRQIDPEAQKRALDKLFGFTR